MSAGRFLKQPRPVCPAAPPGEEAQSARLLTEHLVGCERALVAAADKKQYLSMLYPRFAEVIAMNFAHSHELCFLGVSICIHLLCWMFFSCCFPGYGQLIIS